MTWLRSTLVAALLSAAPPLAALAAPQDAPADAPGEASAKTIETYFKGRVSGVKGRRVTLTYDFTNKAEAADWASTYPFVQPGSSGGFRVDGGSLRGSGSAAWRLRAVFDGEVAVEATLTSDQPRNIGLVMLAEDASTFTLFAVSDSVFSLMDKRMPQEHMITTFLAAGKGPGGSTEWRYVDTSRQPRVEAGSFRISATKQGPMNSFQFGAGGSLKGKDVEATVGPRIAPAFYVLQGSVVVQDVTVTGVLDRKWLKENGITWEDEAPRPDTPEPEPEAGRDAPSPSRGSEGADWRELASRVKDRTLTEDERTAAAEALVETKEGWAVRTMIDLLYDEEDEIGRKVGILVFKGIVKKDAGYNPRAPRDYRLKTMPKIWAYWFRIRSQLEKDAEYGKGMKR